MNPTTATKKRKSTTIVKKKRLSKTLKSKKGKKSMGIHGSKSSGGSLSVGTKDHGKDEGITLSLSTGSDKSASTCNIRRGSESSIREESPPSTMSQHSET